MEPVASSLMNDITGKGVMKAGKGHGGGFLPFLALPLMMKVLEKGVRRAGTGYHKMDHNVKNF